MSYISECSFDKVAAMFFKMLNINLSKLTIVLFVSTLGGGASVFAETLFEENFDNQADWKPTGSECGGFWPERCPDNDVPPGWTWYRNTEKWPAIPGQRISSDTYRGDTGKSWIKSSESDHPAGESNYYSDSILQKVLPTEHDELYVGFWIQFSPTWKWVSSGNGEFKLLRIAHFDGGDGVNPFQMGSTGFTAPMYLVQMKMSNTWGWRAHHEPRCDSQKSHYYCDNEVGYDPLYKCPPGMSCNGYKDSSGVVHPSFEDMFGDGNWHYLEFYVKMNSAPGARDGEFAMWVDGTKHHHYTGHQWRYSDSPSNLGWNSVAIGGNWNNWYSAVANQDEQWYAIDDFVISTTPIGFEKISPPRPPSNVKVNTLSN